MIAAEKLIGRKVRTPDKLESYFRGLTGGNVGEKIVGEIVAVQETPSRSGNGPDNLHFLVCVIADEKEIPVYEAGEIVRLPYSWCRLED